MEREGDSMRRKNVSVLKEMSSKSDSGSSGVVLGGENVDVSSSVKNVDVSGAVENVDVSGAVGNVGGVVVVKEEVAEKKKKRGNVVVPNTRVLRSAVKKLEGVGVENGAVKFPPDEKKIVESCGIGVLLSAAEVVDDQGGSGIVENGGASVVSVDEEVRTGKKENAAVGNKRVLRSHFARKEENAMKEVSELHVQRKKKSNEPADVVISRRRPKSSSNTMVPSGTDGPKVSKDKRNKEKMVDHAEQEAEMLTKKRVLRSYVVKCEEVNDKEELSQPQLEKKRIRESLDVGLCEEIMEAPSDAEVHPKKIRTNSSKSSRNAARGDGASKRSSASPDGQVHGKSNQGDVIRNSHSKRNIKLPNRKTVFREPKRETADILAAGGSRKKGSEDTIIDERKSFSGIKSRVLNKQKATNCSVSIAKQNLRDQIKSMLLNAGWKIDLRPRKSRHYFDSVYIPPDGRGSYWSITKAYAVYQAKLTSAGAEKTRKTGRANRSLVACNAVAEGTSSLSIIPSESLSILKRIVVNKRRSKEEIEQGMKCKKRKANGISDKLSQKRREKVKVSQIRRRKSSDDSSSSYAHASVSSARKHQQSKHLLARGYNQEAECESKDFVPYVWKRTVLSWMIDLGVVPINGKVQYMNSRKTKGILEGFIKRDGIQCSSCDEIVPISEFEHHAGGNLFKASEYIHVEGPEVSLLQCQLDAWEKQDVSERRGFFAIDISGEDPNDDTCGICGDGGDLICCDSCPSTFHLKCLGIKTLPPGDWNCTYCSCRFCGAVSIDDVPESGGTTSLLSCSQCEQKYHPSCVPEANSVHADANNSGTSFCGQKCKKVFMQLNTLIGTNNELEGGFSWSLLRRFDDTFSNSSHSVARRVECNSKIAVAFAVMDECFLPITDQRTGIDLIHNVVYNCGSNFSRLNYKGFYTFVLERGDEIISAASVRIHGTMLAEMPFIGTRNMYRRQGMARLLLSGIESLLRSLNVEKLVIPAISELRDTWTKSFGFRSLKISEELEFTSINLVVFPGIGLLVKPLLENNSAAQQKLAEAKLCDKSNQYARFESSSESPNVRCIIPNLNTSIECLSDDFVDLGANVSPKPVVDPNQPEVSMPVHKSWDVDDDKSASIPSIPPVAERVEPEAVLGTACQLLCEVKGKGIHESGTVETEAEVSDLMVQHKSKRLQSFFIGSKCCGSAELVVIDNHEVDGPASHVTTGNIDMAHIGI